MARECSMGLPSEKLVFSGEKENASHPDQAWTMTLSADRHGLARLKAFSGERSSGEIRVRFGPLTIHATDPASLYTELKDIFINRIYDFSASHPRPVVIDGGGHIGLFSLFAKQRFPEAQVTVFEPDPASFRLLEKNLAANGMRDVVTVPAGLGATDGDAAFATDPADGSSFFGANRNAVVPTVRLSRYLPEETDFLKLNIEGSELEVVTEIKDRLHTVRELVIEYHGFSELGQNLHRILSFLDSAGFRYLIHDFDRETNPGTKPPFRLDQSTRFFLLIYARRLFARKGQETAAASVRPEPVSRKFGFDRGLPVDRYYLEKFLRQNRSVIRGNVLEIGDAVYSRKFGEEGMKAEVFSIEAGSGVTRVGNLETGENVPEEACDCIIMPQTLQMIYDVGQAVRHAMAALKPGGTLLLSASGISQISRYDMDRWGEYWRFTDLSLKKLLSEHAPDAEIEVSSFGNVCAAKAFLDGLAAHELPAGALDHHDPDYQVVLTARVRKKACPAILPLYSPVKMGKASNLKPVILLYHRVADDPIDSQLLAVSPANFEAHLLHLHGAGRVTPLCDLLESAARGPLPSATVALTFDDGYLDNLTNALPLLEKYGIPATIFVTAGMVGSNRELWWDCLEKIFLTGSPLPRILELGLSSGIRRFRIETPEDCKRVWEALNRLLGPFPAHEIDRIIDALFKWSGIDPQARPTHRVLDPEQLRRLSSSPLIEIGAHTVTHSRLSCLSIDGQRQEIAASGKLLREITGKPVRLFSYPFGTPADFTGDTRRILAEEGFIAGIANIQKEVGFPLDPYAVSRRLVRNWSGESFSAWLDADDKYRWESEALGQRERVLAGKRCSPAHGKAGRLSILHVNTHDVAGGAAKVAWRLAEAQQKDGFSAGLLVGGKNSDSKLSTRFAPNPDTASEKAFRRDGLLDYALRGSHGLAEHPLVRSADILHLHNLHGGYFNPFSLVLLSNLKPTVWTLHDMQSLTGHCAHSLGCGKWLHGCGQCQNLSIYPEIAKDATAKLFKEKQWIYRNSDLTIVAPSEWLAEKVRRSILADFPITVIPNGVDTGVFRSFDCRMVRKRFNLPPDAFIMGCAATAGALANPWKGGGYTREVIDRLRARQLETLFLNIGSGDASDGSDIRHFPWIKDEGDMAQLLSAMDVFLFTPIAENCPLVVLESLACGVPVVSFGTGGIPELVRHGVDGFIVPQGETGAMVDVLALLAANPPMREALGKSARKRAVEVFDHRRVARAYEAVYRERLTRKPILKSPRLAGDAFPEILRSETFRGLTRRLDLFPGDRQAVRPEADHESFLKNPPEPHSGNGESARQACFGAGVPGLHGPMITVVTPSFNQGKYLEQCIDSVLSQGYKHLEYVVMDGGSTDGSVEIIRKYEKFLTFWQSRPDGGQYAAVEEGFRRTTGEIMTWLNSDDIFHPDAFRTAAAVFMHRREVAWITGRPNMLNEKGEQAWVCDRLPVWHRGKYLRKQHTAPFIQQEGTFWRRSLWEAAGAMLRTDLELAGDLELWTRFFRHSPLYTIDALMAGYRVHFDQKAQLFRRQYNEEAERVLDQEILQYRQQKDKRLLPPPKPVQVAEIQDYLHRMDESEGSLESGNADRRSRMIEKDPLVSAIVSTYNSERFIRGCLEDLEAQSMADRLEIIVVDSGSGENEREIVEEMKRRYANIRYIRTGHRETVYGAWNRGIEAAKGRYLTIANTDDRHRPDALEKMAKVLESRPDTALVYADVLKTEHENETYENCTPAGRFHWPDWDRIRLMQKGCFIGPQPMWRRSVHRLFGHFDETLSVSGDYEFWLRISQTLDFHHIGEPLGLYLVRADSVEHSNPERHRKEDLEIQGRYVEAAVKGEVIGCQSLKEMADPERIRAASLSMLAKTKWFDRFRSEVKKPGKYLQDTGISDSNEGGPNMQNSERTYENVQALIQAGKEAEAVRELEGLVNRDPSFARAFNDLGVLYYQGKEKDRAVAAYRRAVSLEPENINFLKNLADFLAVEEGKIEEALRLYNRILERDSADVETLLALGHICRSLGRTEDARDFYNRALDAEPWNSDAWDCLEKLDSTGVNPAGLNSTGVTSAGLKPCATIEPVSGFGDTPEEGCRKAQEMAETGREEEAIGVLEELGNRCPGHARAWNDLAVLCYRNGKKEKAGENYRKAVSLEPENPLFVKNLADFLFVEEGCIEEALRMYVKLLEADPADVELLLNLGHICTSLARFEDAEEFYNHALDVEPWNDQAAQSLEKLPEYKKKIAAPGSCDAEPALSTSPVADVESFRAALSGEAPVAVAQPFRAASGRPDGQVSLWIEPAAALRTQGRHDEAARLLEHGLEQNPGQEDLLFCLAEIHLEAGRFDKALEALERKPDAPSSNEKRRLRRMEIVGCCLEGLGRRDEALIQAEKILWLEPGSAFALNLKGKIAYGEGFPEAAGRFFKQAVGCDPGCGEAYTHLGTLKWEKGDAREALRFLEMGFLISPETAACARDYHAAVCELKAFDRAESAFRNAASSQPFNRIVGFLWIDVLLHLKKYPDAVKEIQDLISRLGPEDGVISAGLAAKEKIGFFPEDSPAVRRPKISLCMIAKDEAEQIGGCLASAAPVVDEIIVVDTGSTDRTVDIATLFDARVHRFPWADDFSQARNFSLSQATGDWILIMDADERLSVQDGMLLRETVKSAPPKTAFSVTTRNYTHRANTVGWRGNGDQYPKDAAGCGWFPSDKVRLFPRDPRIRFRHPVHEMVETSLKEADYEIRNCPIPIHHYGKINEARNLEKTKKYFEISRQKLAELAGDPAAIRELAVQAGYLERYEEAVSLWNRFLSSQPDTSEALVNLGSAYWNLGRFPEAREAAGKAIALSPQMKEAHLNFAMSDLFMGDVNGAITVLDPLVEKNPGYLSAHFMLAAACCMDGASKKGIEALKSLGSTAAGPGLAISIEELAGRLTRANQVENARKLLAAAVEARS